MDALRRHEGESWVEAVTERQALVSFLGFDPSGPSDGMTRFTPHVSVSAFRHALSKLVEGQEVTLLKRPSAQPTMPTEWVELHAVARLKARAMRRNQHTPIRMPSIDLSPALKAQCRAAIASWEDQREKLSAVRFDGPYGYVVTSTLVLMHEDAAVRKHASQAQQIAAEARASVRARHEVALSREADRLTRSGLSSAALASPERFREAGVNL